MKLELRKNEEAKGRKDPVIPMKLGDNGTMVPGLPCVTPCDITHFPPGSTQGSTFGTNVIFGSYDPRSTGKSNQPSKLIHIDDEEISTDGEHDQDGIEAHVAS